MRVLITGGAGFVGSHLCDAYIDRGDQVVAIDNLTSGRLENVSHLGDEARFTMVEGDIRHAPEVPGAFDLVLHFASPASPPFYMDHPLLSLETGSIGTQWALDIAREHSARFIVASTSEVYGDPEIHPQTEDYWGNVNPNGPRSVYDEAKRYAEAITAAYRRSFGVNTGMVRIFNTYGPRMRADDGRVVTNFINQALEGTPLTVYGDGSQTRSFCYVSDLVAGIVRLADSAEGDPVNIGNPGEFTMLELAQEVLDLTGSSSELVHEDLPTDDPTRRRPDITRAQAVLGWSPTVELRAGLQATIEHFRGL